MVVDGGGGYVAEVGDGTGGRLWSSAQSEMENYVSEAILQEGYDQ